MDLINRQEAIEWVEYYMKHNPKNQSFEFIQGLQDAYLRVLSDLKSFPPSEPSAERKGRWILVKGSNGKDYHKCSECLHTQDITGVKNFCAVCGADMGGKEDEQ